MEININLESHLMSMEMGFFGKLSWYGHVRRIHEEMLPQEMWNVVRLEEEEN